MNEKEKRNLEIIINVYPDICMNINLFTEFLKPEFHDWLDPITDRSILKTGLYGYLGPKRAKCWLSKFVNPDNCVRVSTTSPKDNSNESDWSKDMKLSDGFERLENLKAFY